MKVKSDSVTCFLHFKKMVENLFSTKIKYFQSDGAMELIKGRFKSVLDDCGIVPRTSCPHTQQQNGIAERKHRHITELGLSLMFHCSMPKQYWLEAFCIAAYLINRLPTLVLSAKSPFEVLFNNRPDYNVLCTFGCACYPYLGDYKQDKLSPKSLQCVFLGYSNQYKGYRCLDPKMGRVYTSRHVVFDETTFPFAAMKSDSHSLATHHQWVNLPMPFTTWLPQQNFPLPTSAMSPQSPSSLSTPALCTADTSPNEPGPPEIIPNSTSEPPTCPTSSPLSSSYTNTEISEPLPPPPIPTHHMLTRLKDGITKPKHLSYLTTKYPIS